MNRFFLCISSLVAIASQAQPAAEEKEEAPLFVRYVAEEKGGGLQTSVVRMKGPDGVGVDLIGAVHVGDAAYYEGLNERFREYEAVLYELVGGPFEDRAKEGAEGRLHWIGALQEKMRTVLKLEGQLDKIDYRAKNLVHADMDLEGFAEAQGKQGETFLGLWLKAMQMQQGAVNEGSAFSNDTTGLLVLMRVLMSRNSSNDLKRLIGREFLQVEKLMNGMEANGGTVIIGKRNEVALEVLDEVMESGKKKVAIFYGAGHLPDMKQRLEEKGFLMQGDPEWLTAWEVKPRAKANPAKKPGKKETQVE